MCGLAFRGFDYSRISFSTQKFGIRGFSLDFSRIFNEIVLKSNEKIFILCLQKNVYFFVIRYLVNPSK
jgi:hypothetical protein